jgi:hypothetical protein
MIPPGDLERSRDHWENIGTVIVNSARSGKLPEPVARLAGMSSAFSLGKPVDFNREAAGYTQWLRARGMGLEVSRSRYEFTYNLFQPYIRATAIYAIALLLLAAYWWKRSTPFYQSGAMLVVVALALHTGALLFEMMIEGRPPLTNRFASVILSGWGLVLLGIVIERFWQKGFALTLAAVSGAAVLVVAHSLAPHGAIILLQSMLDLRFGAAIVVISAVLWLARSRETISVDPATEQQTGSSRAAWWRLRRFSPAQPSV